jgi:hypothetical protein
MLYLSSMSAYRTDTRYLMVRASVRSWPVAVSPFVLENQSGSGNYSPKSLLLKVSLNPFVHLNDDINACHGSSFGVRATSHPLPGKPLSQYRQPHPAHRKSERSLVRKRHIADLEIAFISEYHRGGDGGTDPFGATCADRLLCLHCGHRNGNPRR